MDEITNEKIKELAIQALWHTNKEGETYKTYFKFEERFAKLIIQECAGLLIQEAVTNHDVGDQTYNQLMIEADWMKRYFGIE